MRKKPHLKNNLVIVKAPVHAAAEAEDDRDEGLRLDVVVAKGLVVLEGLAVKDEPDVQQVAEDEAQHVVEHPLDHRD